MRMRNPKDKDLVISNCDYFYEGFTNDFPICLEIGMGKGKFILEMALKYPNINFIGVEINSSQLVRATQILEMSNLKNIYLINMDARNLTKVFGKEIDTIYLTFSEPWPKKRDEKNRFTHESFLKIYDQIFKKDKHIILKTDNKGLFAYSLESLSQYWYIFDTVSLDLHNDERCIPNIMTDFEKQYFKERRPIYYLDAYFKN